MFCRGSLNHNKIFCFVLTCQFRGPLTVWRSHLFGDDGEFDEKKQRQSPVAINCQEMKVETVQQWSVWLVRPVCAGSVLSISFDGKVDDKVDGEMDDDD